MQETHQHTLIHYTTHFRSTEGLLAEERGAEPAGRVDPEEGAGLAEVAEGLRGGAGARPVRVLLAADLDSEPPVVGLLRSEEHTSELQSRFDLVCRLLLEKK